MDAFCRGKRSTGYSWRGSVAILKKTGICTANEIFPPHDGYEDSVRFEGYCIWASPTGVHCASSQKNVPLDRASPHAAYEIWCPCSSPSIPMDVQPIAHFPNHVFVELQQTLLTIVLGANSITFASSWQSTHYLIISFCCITAMQPKSGNFGCMAVML